MGTKSKESAGTQFTPKGIVKGIVLVCPSTGNPIGSVVDVNGDTRLLTDTAISISNVIINVDLDFDDDGVHIGDPSSGNVLTIENDGSININSEIDAADGDNILIVGKEGNDFNEVHIDSKGQLYTNDNLDCGGTNIIVSVTDTVFEVKVLASAKPDRKTVFIQPLAKGVFWGFKNNITADQAATGGAPLGKNQPLEIDATKNTSVFLVGPQAGLPVYIAEA